MQRSWYPFRMSHIAFVWVLKNYIYINQRIWWGPDMITFLKFIKSILGLHHSLNLHTWELVGFQFSLTSWIVMYIFHLMYFENWECISIGMERKKNRLLSAPSSYHVAWLFQAAILNVLVFYIWMYLRLPHRLTLYKTAL